MHILVNENFKFLLMVMSKMMRPNINIFCFMYKLGVSTLTHVINLKILTR